MRQTLLCLLLFYTVNTLSQNRLQWRDGVVVLRTDQVLTGRFTFEPFLGVVLLEDAARKREVYGAHQVKSLYYHDSKSNLNRRFISLREPQVHRGDTFYEVVIQGEASLLRRQTLRFKHLSDVTDYDYFTWFQEQLVPLRHFNRVVYPALEREQILLSVFRTENRLHPAHVTDAIQLIEYFNQLTRAAETLARQ